MAKKNAVAQVELNLEELARVEEAEIIAAAEPTVLEVDDIAQAMSEAHGGVQAQAEDETSDEAQVAAQAEDEVQAGSFKDMVDAVTDADVQSMIAAYATSFGDRAAYEREKKPDNDNIQKTLSKEIKGHQAYGMAKILVAAGVSPDYINASEVTGKRRNVYSFEKLRDLASAANGSMLKNAINRATMVSLVKLRDVGLPFTGEIARGCASDKTAVPVHYRPHMSRHTVSEGVASTQSSSTMTALEVLGVVKNLGSQRNPVWELTDTLLTKGLIETVRLKHIA